MRIVRVGEPLRDSDTDLTSGYLERVAGLIDRDLSSYTVDDLSIIECNVAGLLLPEGDAWVYMRRCTGLMRVRQRPDPVGVPQEIGSLFLRRAQDAASQIAGIAADVGNAVMSQEGRLCWEAAWPIYSDKYGQEAMDEAVKFVCADYPNLLAHWERAKLQPRGLVEDSDPALAALLSARPWTNPDDRYEINQWVEANYRQLPMLAHFQPDPPARFRFHAYSLDPFVFRAEVTAASDFWRVGPP